MLTTHLSSAFHGTIALLADIACSLNQLDFMVCSLNVPRCPLYKLACWADNWMVSSLSALFSAMENSTGDCRTCGVAEWYSKSPNLRFCCFKAGDWGAMPGRDRGTFWPVGVELGFYSSEAAKLRTITLVYGYGMVAAVAWSTIKLTDVLISAAVVPVAAKK